MPTDDDDDVVVVDDDYVDVVCVKQIQPELLSIDPLAVAKVDKKTLQQTMQDKAKLLVRVFCIYICFLLTFLIYVYVRFITD